MRKHVIRMSLDHGQGLWQYKLLDIKGQYDLNNKWDLIKLRYFFQFGIDIRGTNILERKACEWDIEL